MDRGKVLERVTSLRQQAAKCRDAIRAEVEELRALLSSREEDLARHERDVEQLQQQVARLALDTTGTGPAVKRTSQPAPGMAGVKHAKRSCRRTSTAFTRQRSRPLDRQQWIH